MSVNYYGANYYSDICSAVKELCIALKTLQRLYVESCEAGVANARVLFEGDPNSDTSLIRYRAELSKLSESKKMKSDIEALMSFLGYAQSALNTNIYRFTAPKPNCESDEPSTSDYLISKAGITDEICGDIREIYTKINSLIEKLYPESTME